MNRTINLFRRRPNIVDLMVPVTAGVAQYRLKWAQNFDGVFAQIIGAPLTGFYDDTIDRGRIDSQPSTGTSVRMTFNPATFAIPDARSFWIQLWHLPIGGGPEAAVSAPSLVLPESAHHGIGVVTIQGNAPNGASSANALQLDLPRLMSDFRIINQDAATILYVSTEANGAEEAVKPAPADQYSSKVATQGSLWVRGGGAICPFSATFTMAFPR
jgi:hypothetical protein